MAEHDISLTERNRAAIVRWFDEVWNQGREAAIDELFLPEGRTFGFPEPESSDDHTGFKVFYRRFRTAFSGIDIRVEDTVCEGNKVAVRWIARMTHSGDGFGFPPTGERVAMTGMSFAEMRDGKILNAWDVYDITRVTTMLQRVAAATTRNHATLRPAQPAAAPAGVPQAQDESDGGAGSAA